MKFYLKIGIYYSTIFFLILFNREKDNILDKREDEVLSFKKHIEILKNEVTLLRYK